jgi:hypothetical protein
MKKVVKCPHCKRNMGRWIQMEGFMAKAFLDIVMNLSQDREVEWKEKITEKKSRSKKELLRKVILAKEVKQYNSDYNSRLSCYKHWGLLDQRPEWWHQGIYTANEMTFSFLRNEVPVNRFLLVFDQAVLETDGGKVFFKEAIGSRWNEIPDWINDALGKRPLAGLQLEMFA